MEDSREYTLAELADAAGMTQRNVRAYLARGLLPAARRDGRRSLFGPDHVARLRLVRSLHQHGLTLRVIGDLVGRGTADAELARLVREEMPPGATAVRVPMSAGIVETYELEHPGGMDALLAAGLIVRHGDRFVANASSLGIVAALSARGVGVADSAAVALCAARAAHASADEMQDVLDGLAESDGRDDQLSVLVVQMAANAFADVLGTRLTRPGR